MVLYYVVTLYLPAQATTIRSILGKVRHNGAYLEKVATATFFTRLYQKFVVAFCVGEYDYNFLSRITEVLKNRKTIKL